MYNSHMKIMATSDLHGNLEGLDFTGIDIGIIAGDFAIPKGSSRWDIYHQQKWINQKFAPFLASFKDCEFIVVPGNHDFCMDPKRTARYADCKVQWPSNVHMLLDSGSEIKGLKAYGTPYVPIISYSWAFEAEHDELKSHFAKIPSCLDILVCHTPPRISGEAIDISLQYGITSQAFGSAELTQALFNKHPRLCFCGHIHSGFHKPVTFNSTTIYNVSRVDESYEIAYEPTVIEL